MEENGEGESGDNDNGLLFLGKGSDQNALLQDRFPPKTGPHIHSICTTNAVFNVHSKTVKHV